MFSKLCRSMEMAPSHAKRARRTDSPKQTKQAPGKQRKAQREAGGGKRDKPGDFLLIPLPFPLPPSLPPPSLQAA